MASEVTKRLRDRRLQTWEEAKKIATDAANEQRAMTPDEQGRWDVMQDEMEKLDQRIKSTLDAEKRAKDADQAFDDLEGRTKTGPEGPAAQRDFQEELRKWARGEQGSPKALEIRHQGAGPVNYRILTGPNATGTASGVIPTDFYDQLIAYLIEVSGLMQCGPTVLNTGGGETLQIPRATTHSTAASGGQAAALATSDPVFSQVTLGATKFGVLLQVARELIDDSGVDLLGYLAMQAGRAVGKHYELSAFLPAALVLLAGCGQDDRVLQEAGRHQQPAGVGALGRARVPGPAARQADRGRPVHARGRVQRPVHRVRGLQPVLRPHGGRGPVRTQ